jgi:outer membrane protein with beta-barrel domain
MTHFGRCSVFAAALLLACAPPLRAQDRGLGVTGGVVLATQQISGESNPPSFDVRVAAVVGAFYTLPVSSRLGVQVEGLYAMKGAKLNVLGIKSTLQTDYLEVPILARLRLGDGHRHYYVDGGVAPAFLLRARAATAFSGGTEELDITDTVERLDLGVAAGGGIVIGAYSIDGRLTFGLRDIDADKTDTSHTKNRVVAVTAGYRF